MNHYQQSLAIEASPAAVYEALTTPAGLHGWWTRDADVATREGGTVHLRFGPTRKALRIERLEPAREVRWRCTSAHLEAGTITDNDEWVNTQIVFRLSPGEGGEARTQVDFEHIGLVPDFECYDVCRAGWQHFLGSLQQFAETGSGTPFEPASAPGSCPGARSTQMSPSEQQSTDCIERSIVIDAPRAKVWHALSDAETFGTWFGAKLQGQAFRPGQRTRGQITIAGFEHVWFDVLVERVEPQELLSYRWHPYAIDPKEDYGREEPTLVTLRLQDAPGGRTLVSVVESGFDRVPPHRRLEAFRMNNKGWDAQLANLTRHVTS